MRDTEWRHLHPAFRVIAEELSPKAKVLQLQPYEGARSPIRQVDLYARGRTAPGNKVTHARAWESLHQYGFALDYVFNVNGKWTWEEPRKGAWAEFRRIALGCGLKVLSFEVPHVEFPVSLTDLRAGRYPIGGDAPWESWLETEIEKWGPDLRVLGGLEHPGAPSLPTTDRPSLEEWEAFPLPPSPFT